MPFNCPYCDSELVASAVGLLCPDCGSLHNFYKADGIKPEPLDIPRQNKQEINSDSYQIETPSHPLPKRMKMLLARMIVPELPSPHDSEQLLESHLEPVVPPKKPIAITVPATTTIPSNNQSNAMGRIKHFDARLPLIICGLILLIVAGGAGTYIRLTKKFQNETKIEADKSAIESTKSKLEAEKKERDIKRKQDIKEIATALEVYKKDIGTYPVGNQIQATYVMSKAAPKYINYVNEDPLSTKENHIYYSYRSDGKSFILSAKLENTNDGEAIDGYYIIQSGG